MFRKGPSKELRPNLNERKRRSLWKRIKQMIVECKKNWQLVTTRPGTGICTTRAHCTSSRLVLKISEMPYINDV